MIAVLDYVLHRNVQQYQRPGSMIHGVGALPVLAGALAEEVKQEHIREQKDMLPQTVSSVEVDVVGGVVPYLYHGECAEYVG